MSEIKFGLDLSLFINKLESFVRTRWGNHHHLTGSRPLLEQSWCQAVLVEICQMRTYLTVSPNPNVLKYNSKNLQSYFDALIIND